MSDERIFRELKEMYDAYRTEFLAKQSVKRYAKSSSKEISFTLPSYMYYQHVYSLIELMRIKIEQLRQVLKKYKIAREVYIMKRNNRLAYLYYVTYKTEVHALYSLIKSLKTQIIKMLRGKDNRRIPENEQLISDLEELDGIIRILEQAEPDALNEVEEYMATLRRTNIDELIHIVIELLKTAGIISFSKEEGYWCNICGRRFVSEDEIIDHIINEHKMLKDPDVRRKVIKLIHGEDVEESDEDKT